MFKREMGTLRTQDIHFPSDPITSGSHTSAPVRIPPTSCVFGLLAYNYVQCYFLPILKKVPIGTAKLGTVTDLLICCNSPSLEIGNSRSR